KRREREQALKAGASKAPLKAPETRQGDTNQPSWVRLGRPKPAPKAAAEEERSRIVRLSAGEREEAFKQKQREEEAKWEKEQSEAEPGASRALVVVPQRPPVADGFKAALAWMNEHHAIIDNVGGKCVIAGWEKSEQSPGRLVVVFQGKESFLL